MIHLFDSIDSELLLWFNSFHTPFWDEFIYTFSSKWIWVPMYAALLVVLTRAYGWRRVWPVLLFVALAITLADQITASLIRPAVGRLRPSNPDNPLSELVTVVNGYRGGMYGFPSCHAANSFALVCFILGVVRSRAMAATLLLWATANSLSRACLGVHYPGDLTAGAVVGVCCGLLCAFCCRWMMRRTGGTDERISLPDRTTTAAVPAVAAVTVAAIALMSI